MNVSADVVAAATALGACFFAALFAYSLRDFSRSRLEEACAARNRNDRFGVILKEHADALLAVEWLLALLIASLAVSTFRWLTADDLEGSPDPWSTVTLQTLSFAFVVSLVVVVVPWCVARVVGERVLAFAWPLIAVWKSLMRPPLAVARRLDTYAHRLTGLEEPGSTDGSEFSEELRTVVDEGQREGAIEREAGTMIRRVIELQEADVSAIMTQRTDMVTIQMSSSLEEARLKFLECGHSRIPVVGQSTDDVVGILYAKDLLRHRPDDASRVPELSDVVREPLYVPETSGIDSLLETMKRDRVHFAMVIDEYGNVAGLVTMEDILEEIVGEIGDEFDTAEEKGIFPIRPGVVELAAWVRIDSLNEEFEFELPEDEDFATLGGFVLSQLGRIPKPGESLPWKEWRITVLSSDKRKIDRLRIEADPTLPAPEPMEH